MFSRKIVPTSKKANNMNSKPNEAQSPVSESKVPQEYEDINVVQLLSKAKFPVYLAHSASKNRYFALKLYNFEDGKPHPYFKNEARFSFLNHQNVIKIENAEEKPDVSSPGSKNQISCILMEYAPHGDIFDFVKKVGQDFPEKLVRTYFRQLIEGVEYLHKNDVCHFDLKLENLLLGEDYQLKIADFDLSHVKGDSKILTRGTRYYRAPELRASKGKISSNADIYAAGIILFVMKCGGTIPHAEDDLYKGINLRELMDNNSMEFFKKHCEIQGRNSSFFSQEFKDLFTSMVKADPEKRATIAEIKKSKWYNGQVYTKEELKKKVKAILRH